jgi:flagellar protein FlgJ
MDVLPLSATGTPGSAADPGRDRGVEDASLRRAAANFEAVFLAEMLNVMGLGREPSGFGGGFGAEAFQSFLHEAYARELVRRGGVGIADTLYQQLKGDPFHG